MARIRSIKPELRTSLTVAEWPREVRYFWVLLWGYLDDYGRGVDDPRLIKADCFPLDDDLTATDIGKWVGLIADTITPGEPAPLCRYEVNGRRYLHATRWHEHQKPQHPKDPKIPACPRPDCGGSSRGLHEDVTKSSGSPHEITGTSLPTESGRSAPHEDVTKSSGDSHADLTPEQGEGEVVGDGAGRGNAQGATLPGTALLDAYLAKASPRPSKDDVRKLSEVVDRLVAEKTPVDVLAEALERYRDKTRYGPNLLRRLATDIVAERAGQADGAPPRGRSAPPRQTNYTDEDYASGWKRSAQ